MTKLFDLLLSKEVYTTIIKIGVYILIGYIGYILLKRLLLKSLNKHRKKRQQTITKLIISIIKAIIIVIEITLILQLLGIDVTSILAGLGIATVVLGLALQDIMKDVLAGIFIIIEDQFDVGDIVEINGFTGTVQAIGFKSTKIKSYDGKLKITSNRNISEVINYSKSNTFAVVDIPLSYEEKVSNVEKIILSLKEKIKEKVENVIDVKILDIEEFSSSSINYRILIETKPGDHFTARRAALKLIKEELDKQNISIPYNKLEVINGK